MFVATNYKIETVASIQRLKVSKGKYDKERDVASFFATASVSINPRVSFGGDMRIPDWTVKGDDDKTIFGDHMIENAIAVHRARKMPVLFVDFCIGQMNNMPRHLFAVATSTVVVSP